MGTKRSKVAQPGGGPADELQLQSPDRGAFAIFLGDMDKVGAIWAFFNFLEILCPIGPGQVPLSRGLNDEHKN